MCYNHLCGYLYPWRKKQKSIKKEVKIMSFAEFVQGVLGFLEEIKTFLFNFGEYAQIFFDLLP